MNFIMSPCAIFFIFISMLHMNAEIINDNIRPIAPSIKTDSKYKQTEDYSAAVFYNRGMVFLYQLNDLDRAIDYFNKALAREPENVKVIDSIAIAYRKKRDYQKSLEFNKKSISIFPEGEVANMNLATTYICLEDYNGAISQYKILKNLNPENPESYYGLANVYIITRDFQQAIENAQEAIRLYSTQKSQLVGDAENLLAIAYSKSGNNELAKYWKQIANEHKTDINSEIPKLFNKETD